MDNLSIKKEYKGLPFWSWNGTLETDEIVRQVNVLHQMGFGGFFMHSRTGLQTEYLGDKWFECIKAATAEAEKLNMSAWLYDEDRWPSGTAGGEITKKKEYRLKFISEYEVNQAQKTEIFSQEDILGVFAVAFNGDKVKSYRKIDESSKVDAKEKILAYKIEYMEGQEFYNGYTYVDTLNREATEAYLLSTHEKYKDICGDMFGKTLLGIFTDEPHRGAIFNGFGIQKNANGLNMAPYTYKLFDEFKAAFGYDLSERIVELYYNLEGKEYSTVSYHYVEILQRMFIDNFARPYQDWCKKNNLILTGHVLHEDSLAIQTVFQGSVQRYYEYMDYPGVDILTEGNNAYFVAKQVQGVARQLCKPFCLSELYGCTGWQMNFESHRDVGAWQALCGINLRCHHLSWYTMEGEAKRDYPASIFYQSGYWRDYGYIEEYFARLNRILSEGTPICDTLVINPVESVWLHVKKGWLVNLFQNTVEEVKAIEKHYFELFDMLMTGQTDFDYGDEDIISRHYKIEKVGGEAVLKVGAAVYKNVLVSGNETLRSSTVKILNEFIEAGGKVIEAGGAPKYIDGVARTNADAYSKLGLIKTDFSRESILPLIGCKLYKLNSGEVMTTAVNYNDGAYVVCLNKNRQERISTIVKFNDSYNIYNVDLSSGEVDLVAKNCDNVKLNLFKGECRVYYITNIDKSIGIKVAFAPQKTVKIDGEMEYMLNEPNILPLDFVSYSLKVDNKIIKSDKPTEVLFADREVRGKLNLPLRSGEMIQPWFKAKYNLNQSSVNADIDLTFKFNAKILPKGVKLVLEQSERYTAKLNGKAFKLTSLGSFIDPCFDTVSIPDGYITNGENTLVLSGKFDDTLNIECLYLIGDFGVKAQNQISEIIELPSKLSCNDITVQGLPFYSGSVTFNTNIKAKRAAVKLESCLGAYAKVHLGSSNKIIAFDPYYSGEISSNTADEIKLEVVLTRRNTFGPLHLKGKYAGAYGPETFIAPQLYTEEYSLIPQGLIGGALVEIIE